MAVRTTLSSGNWGDPIWDGAVPIDGDSAVIDTGHTVTLDVDQSGFATGIAGLTITGTLQASEISDPYLKMAGHVTGAGTLGAGTSTAVPYPAARTFTIELAGDFSVGNNTALDVQLFCVEAATVAAKYAQLTIAGSALDTELTIDTDQTANWVAGQQVYVCDIKVREAEIYTIDSLTATTVTLTAGLSNAKSIGAAVTMVTRNIRILGIDATTTYGIRSSATGCNVYAEVADCKSSAYQTHSANFGGAFHNASTAVINTCNNSIMTGIAVDSGAGLSAGEGGSVSVTALLVGCQHGETAIFWGDMNGVIACCANGMLGGAMAGAGTIKYCNNGMNRMYHAAFAGSITFCANGINQSNVILHGATLANNTRDIFEPFKVIGYGASLDSATQV